MGSARRSISNLGDVQIALNDVFGELEKLTTKGQDLNQRVLTGIPTPTKDLDAVNYTTLKSYVASAIEEVKKLIPMKTAPLPPDASSISFNKNIVPKTDNTFSIGSTLLRWKDLFIKGTASFEGSLLFKNLTASRPLKLDSGFNVIASKIDLASSNDVQNQLTVPNGGTGLNTISQHNIPVGNGGAALNTIPPSTGGYVLTSNGGAADPSFQVLPGGSSGALVVSVTTLTLQYKDWAGVNQTATVVDSVSITTNNFTNGLRTT